MNSRIQRVLKVTTSTTTAVSIPVGLGELGHHDIKRQKERDLCGDKDYEFSLETLSIS